MSFPFSGHAARHSRDCAPEFPISRSCLAPSIAACAARPVTPRVSRPSIPGERLRTSLCQQSQLWHLERPKSAQGLGRVTFPKSYFRGPDAISRDLDPPTFHGIVLIGRGLRSRWYPENAGPFSVPGEGRTFRRAAAGPYASSTRPGVAGVGGAVFGLRCRVWRGPPEGLWPVQYPVPGTTPKMLA